MLKLIKYEFIKAKTLLIVSAVALGVIEVLFLLGFFLENGTLFGWGVGLFFAMMFFGLVAILIFAIKIFVSELKNKSGYMLFMLPKNGYQIVGSKILTSLIVLIIGFIVYVSLGIFNLNLVLERGGSDILYFIENLISVLDWSVLLFVFEYILEWFVMILTIYFAVTLTYTFLSNVKAKGFIAFLVYMALNTLLSTAITAVLSGKLFGMVNMELASYSQFMSEIGWYMLGLGFFVNVIFGVLMYVGTSYLVEKKLSL